MKVGPKYKIARRLGAQVFEKTQGKKYALREGEQRVVKGSNRPKTDFALQMLEKQRVRFTYVITERRLSNYAEEVLEKRLAKPEEKFFELLETRLDSVILRAGFAPTRFMAKQLASHGHFTVNGTKVTVPSLRIKKGDVVAVREGSKNKPMFANLVETNKDAKIPNWLSSDFEKKVINVSGMPTYAPTECAFNLTTVLEYYRR
ncbi:MAG: ribosomal protein small subunit ribosomal protein [Candidatus Parcubacteria bacterium]|jgi:small subunit ribosomal protein S4